jgi:putative hydrolase of the HAD superfamily
MKLKFFLVSFKIGFWIILRLTMEGTMIRAVIFDFGNVIASFDYQGIVQRLSPFSGFSTADLEQQLRQSIPFFQRFETGSIVGDAFYREFVDLTRLRLGKEELMQMFADIFSPISFTCDLLPRLKPRYRLGLLSNTNPWHFERVIRHTAVFPLFDAVSLSFQVGAMKPDPRIYQDMLHKLDLPPAECVFIDDLQENVTAAHNLGLAAILYTTPDTLLTALKSLSIQLAPPSLRSR